MKYLLQNGDIYINKIEEKFFLFSKNNNTIYEINQKQYFYLEQEINNFKFDENIEKTLSNNLKTESVNKSLKNLIINVNIRKKQSFAFILQKILDSYNYYNKIIIVIEMNYDSFYILENIINWIDGYERVNILCRIDFDDSDVIDNFKIYSNKIMSNSSIKVFKEYYSLKNSFENDVQLKNSVIKISPFLSSQKINDLELEKISKYLTNIKSSEEFRKSLKSDLKIRPTDIYSITDYEIIFTEENNNNTCSKCWAQNVCFANNFYKLFSNHPLSCAINQQNCRIILQTIEKTIIETIICNKENVKNKLLNKKIVVGENVITLINP